MAINFHQKALADRLEENLLGLEALDCLSNAQLVASKKPHHKRGHKSMSSTGTIDLATLPDQGQQEDDCINTSAAKSHQTTSVNNSKIFPSKSAPEPRPKRRKKKVTSVIIDQVCHFAHQTQPRFFCLAGFPNKVGGAIRQFALKDSRFHKQGSFIGLDSARKLARKLFSALRDASLARSHLVVEGKSHRTRILLFVLNDTSDFYPYFRSTSKAVSVTGHKQLTTSLIDYL